MDSMAAVATSAALPWMGVLMAALNACPCIKRHCLNQMKLIGTHARLPRRHNGQQIAECQTNASHATAGTGRSGEHASRSK